MCNVHNIMSPRNRVAGKGSRIGTEAHHLLRKSCIIPFTGILQQVARRYQDEYLLEQNNLVECIAFASFGGSLVLYVFFVFLDSIVIPILLLALVKSIAGLLGSSGLEAQQRFR